MPTCKECTNQKYVLSNEHVPEEFATVFCPTIKKIIQYKNEACDKFKGEKKDV